MPTSLDRLTAALAGRYAIEREIGAGGMATVYLARDVRHNRRVALKVLKPELGIVLGTERFLSEIETTANLQHPHLLPLFDSGEAEGLLFYVMPFVEGESLRQRLERERQLPVDEAIRIATAIANALDYAHRHGVIHRDLKPENILLHDGQPVVTDFGIALAISNAGGARITQTGLSLGTPQYMSPEQATGDRVIDARSDIYSLGAVLFEMLVGDPPHSAGTTQAIIAKVLTEKPPSVHTLRDTVPEHVDLAVQKALAKLAADRFASADEFARALSGAKPIRPQSPPGERNVAASTRARVASWRGWVVGVLGVLVAAWSIFLRSPAPQVAHFVTTMPDSVRLTFAALSPDGLRLYFDGRVGGQTGIFMRTLDDPSPQFLRGSEGGSGPVAVSPSGEFILFNREPFQIIKLPSSGGTPAVLADSAANGAWESDDAIVFESWLFRIGRISADGTGRTLLAAPDTSRGHIRYEVGQVLPGGKAALINIFKGNFRMVGSQLRPVLGFVSIPDGRVTELGIPGENPSYLRSGHLTFLRPDGIRATAPFSVGRLNVTGPAVPSLVGAVGFEQARQIADARNGTLAYLTQPTVESEFRLTAVGRSGAARPISDNKGNFRFPRYSPDGRRIAVTTIVGDRADVSILDIASGTLTRLTTTGFSTRPEWTHDGKRVAFLDRDSIGSSIKWQPWDGSGSMEMLVRPKQPVAEVALGSEYAAFRVFGPVVGGNRDIWIGRLDSLEKVRPFMSSPEYEGHPRISPNGHLLAYVADESGREEVYVRPMPGPGVRVQVSSGGGTEPMWSPNGRELVYRGPIHFMVATISERPELAVTTRDTLLLDIYPRNPDHPNFDVSPDGRELLVVARPLTAARDRELHIVLNWTELLKRQASRR